MKKSLVFLFASVALSACGGTIEAEDPNTLRSVKQALTCPSTCLCGQCGWVCGESWNSYEWRYQWRMVRVDCTTDGYQCGMHGDSIRCQEPCTPGQIYAEPCVSM